MLYLKDKIKIIPMIDPNEKARRWLLPADAKFTKAPGLYLVATPIGNLGDITLRALDVLAGVDLVLCEDTRMTGKLLSHYGIKAKLGVYNDQSDAAFRDKIRVRIAEGEAIALVSDAGTPLIADPGYKLVHDIREAGLYLTTIPGPSSVISALQLSGLPSDKFAFGGFLPAKQIARRKALQNTGEAPLTWVLFETAPRLPATLADISDLYPDRIVSVVREISKRFETVKTGKAREVLSFYKSQGEVKGEIVLVIAPSASKNFSEDEIDHFLREALQDNPTKKAAALVAEKTGLSKTALYERALQLKSQI